jgi:dynein heavy chain
LENFENNLEAIFIYSVIWSIGCTTDYDGRVKFSAFLLDILHENKSKFIPNGFVYDYNFNIEKGIFYPWTEDIKNF